MTSSSITFFFGGRQIDNEFVASLPLCYLNSKSKNDGNVINVYWMNDDDISLWSQYTQVRQDDRAIEWRVTNNYREKVLEKRVINFLKISHRILEIFRRFSAYLAMKSRAKPWNILKNSLNVSAISFINFYWWISSASRKENWKKFLGNVLCKFLLIIFFRCCSREFYSDEMWEKCSFPPFSRVTKSNSLYYVTFIFRVSQMQVEKFDIFIFNRDSRRTNELKLIEEWFITKVVSSNKLLSSRNLICHLV